MGAEPSPAALWGGFCSLRGSTTFQLSHSTASPRNNRVAIFPPGWKEVTVPSNSSPLPSTQNPFVTQMCAPLPKSRELWTSAGLFPFHPDTVHLERAGVARPRTALISDNSQKSRAVFSVFLIHRGSTGVPLSLLWV